MWEGPMTRLFSLLPLALRMGIFAWFAAQVGRVSEPLEALAWTLEGVAG